MQIDVVNGAQYVPSGSQGTGRLRIGSTSELQVNDTHGRLYEASRLGRLFVAHAIVTAPVIWSTAAGTGGPLIWNGSSTVNVNLLALGLVETTATSVPGSLGITGNIGQTAAPGSVTAIDSKGCLLISNAVSQSTSYRVGTPTNAGGFFLSVATAGTNAVTAQIQQWYDLAGMVTVPPNCWASVAASATLTSGVYQVTLAFEEVPIA